MCGFVDLTSTTTTTTSTTTTMENNNLPHSEFSTKSTHKICKPGQSEEIYYK